MTALISGLRMSMPTNLAIAIPTHAIFTSSRVGPRFGYYRIGGFFQPLTPFYLENSPRHNQSCGTQFSQHIESVTIYKTEMIFSWEDFHQDPPQVALLFAPCSQYCIIYLGDRKHPTPLELITLVIYITQISVPTYQYQN
jgi:hypothetical protein